MDFTIFRGKRVLLTGHTGFKGSWLVLWLHHLGAEVVGYSNDFPSDPNHFEIAQVATCMHCSITGDICDLEHFKQVFDETRPDLVMHLAAQSVVKTGYDDPVQTFSTNVMGTVHIMEAVRRSGHPCGLLIVSSDKCYENSEQIWGYRECDPMGSHDPYGGSKGAAELAVRVYRSSFFPVDRIDEHGVWMASCRAGNVIGGGDWTDHALVVDTFKAISAGNPVQIRNPLAIRPWQHVLQCLSGYLVVAAGLLARSNPDMCGDWNIGPNPGGELTVQEVVEYFIECWGGGSWEHVGQSLDAKEAMILRVAIDKALTKLNWQPTWDVYKTLQKTVQWYQHFVADPTSMKEFSLKQIKEFESQFNQAKIPQKGLVLSR